MYNIYYIFTSEKGDLIVEILYNAIEKYLKHAKTYLYNT